MKLNGFNFLTLLFVVALTFAACSPAPATISSVPAASTNAPDPTLTGTNTATITPTSMPSLAPVSPTPTLAPMTAFIKAIEMGNPHQRLDSESSKTVITQNIISSGANYVVFTPTCIGQTYYDVNVDCGFPQTPEIGRATSDEELINAIEFAHHVGLRVVVKFGFINIDKIHHHFVNPPLGSAWSETQWKTWFDNYITAVMHYAQIAEEYHVDLFSIGNEMADTTQREQDWRRVIAAVRNVYQGPITYGALAFGFEASRIKFWDALDYIATNGYSFGQVNITSPTVDEMVQAWQPYLHGLEEMSKQYGKQVIITEIGARSVQGNNSGRVHDWDAPLYDGQAQADFYTAFFKALMDKPWVKGIILFVLDTAPMQGGVNDLGYSFVAKPAEQVVHEYFGGVPIVVAGEPKLVEIPDNAWTIYDDSLGSGWMVDIDPSYKLSKAFADFPNSNLCATKGHTGACSLHLPMATYKGIGLIYGWPFINLQKYKWLEFYIMTGKRQPPTLVTYFSYWSELEQYSSRLALINDPKYIEGGQYQPDLWQRVRIPLSDLGITNERFNELSISGCDWPCAPNPNPNTDDVYIDDIRLVAGEAKDPSLLPMPMPAFVEDQANSMTLYKDGLQDSWQLWDEPNVMILPDFNSRNGFQDTTSIYVPLSKTPGFVLLYNGQGLDMSLYKYIEFYLLVRYKEPKNLTVSLGDWAAGAPGYDIAMANNPYYIEDGQYQPGTWQRIRIPLIDLGITNQIFTAPAFGIRNCGWPCVLDPSVDDIYIDDIRLVAGK